MYEARRGGVSFLSCLSLIAQWNLSKTATCGPVIIGLYREVAALQR